MDSIVTGKILFCFNAAVVFTPWTAVGAAGCEDKLVTRWISVILMQPLRSAEPDVLLLDLCAETTRHQSVPGSGGWIILVCALSRVMLTRIRVRTQNTN